MNHDICLYEGCDSPPRTRGLCNRHYRTAREMGTVDDIGLPSQRPRTPFKTVEEAPDTVDCDIHGRGVRARKRQYSYGGIIVSCRACDRGHRNRKKANPEKTRQSLLWRKYGITVAEYQIRYEAQNGACLICKQPAELLCVDHDHDTGQVRGLLCVGCNTGLGMFRDNPESLRRAIQYLRRHR